MGFIIYYLVLIVNPMGRILVRWKSFRNKLEMHATLSAIGCTMRLIRSVNHVLSACLCRLNVRSLLQNIVSFIGLFSKETYNLIDPTEQSHPMHCF